MRGSGVLLSITLVLAVGCGPRSDTRADAASPAAGAAAPVTDPALEAPSPGAPGSFAAEVAGVDVKEGRIVLRNPSASGAGASAGEKSVPVAESARPLLSSLKPGDQVVVACDPPSQTPVARRRDIAPAGGNDGIGPIAPDSDALRRCTAVASLMRVAEPLR
jgi:hypothetical protein